MTTVLAVVVGAAVIGIGLVVLVERLANRRLPPADSELGDGAASGMLGELVEIFQPSSVHLTAERERQRLDIKQTPAEGAPFGVDLDRGTAVLDAENSPEREPGH